MLGKTHIRIAKEIAKDLKLSESESNLLETGSVSPDSWENFPHHYGKNVDIVLNIIKARQQFVNNDDECFHTLGLSLHYLQDKWTLRPRIKDAHTKWEVMIDSAQISDNLSVEIGKSGFPTKAKNAYLSFIEKIEKGINGISEAEIRKVKIFAFKTIIYIHNEDEDNYLELGEKRDLIKSGKPPFWAKEIFLTDMGKRVILFAMQPRPSSWSNPTVDLDIAYRICLEVTRKVFSIEEGNEDWFDYLKIYPLAASEKGLKEEIRYRISQKNVRLDEPIFDSLEVTTLGNTPIFNITGHIDARFKTRFLSSEKGKIIFKIKFNAQNKEIISIEHSRSK